MPTVTCIKCEQDREVSTVQAWRIKTGARLGYCMGCWNQEKRNNPIVRDGMSQAWFRVGHEPWHKGKTLPYMSRPGAIGRRSWSKGKKLPQFSGSNHWNWQGGITALNHSIRTSLEYSQWRTAVYERDNYTCVECGEKGGKLQADHIKPFSRYPELRLDVTNGRTLCEDCHRKIGWNLFKEDNPRSKDNLIKNRSTS